jgi:uncharacterized protein (TIGR02452 family)
LSGEGRGWKRGKMNGGRWTSDEASKRRRSERDNGIVRINGLTPHEGLVDIGGQLGQTEVYLVRPREISSAPTPRPLESLPPIDVTPASTIEVLRSLVRRDDTTAMAVRLAALVFGSLDDHETLYREGYTGQEIDIAYASNTHSKAVMDELEDMYKVGNPPEGTDFMAVIKKAVVFRDHELKLAQPCVASFITAVAPNYDKLCEATCQRHAEDMLDERIAGILKVAHAYGFTVLVLGAFGCGNRRNPPEIVAGIFKKYLVEQGWAKCFARIVFAIYTTPEFSRNDPVYKAFHDVFGSSEDRRT